MDIDAPALEPAPDPARNFWAVLVKSCNGSHSTGGAGGAGQLGIASIA